MNELLLSIRKNAIGLGLFALVTVGAIAATYSLTSARISHNIALAQAKALNEIAPVGNYDNDILADTISLKNIDTSLLGPIKKDAKIHLAKQGDNITTWLIPAVAP